MSVYDIVSFLFIKVIQILIVCDFVRISQSWFFQNFNLVDLSCFELI